MSMFHVYTVSRVRAHILKQRGPKAELRRYPAYERSIRTYFVMKSYVSDSLTGQYKIGIMKDN